MGNSCGLRTLCVSHVRANIPSRVETAITETWTTNLLFNLRDNSYFPNRIEWLKLFSFSYQFRISSRKKLSHALHEDTFDLIIAFSFSLSLNEPMFQTKQIKRKILFSTHTLICPPRKNKNDGQKCHGMSFYWPSDVNFTFSFSLLPPVVRPTIQLPRHFWRIMYAIMDRKHCSVVRFGNLFSKLLMLANFQENRIRKWKQEQFCCRSSLVENIPNLFQRVVSSWSFTTYRHLKRVSHISDLHPRGKLPPFEPFFRKTTLVI